MSRLNELYLSELSKQYKIKNTGMFDGDFSSYCLPLNKKRRVHLILCNKYSRSFDVNAMLDEILLMDNILQGRDSFLCVMPTENAASDLCTYRNGKSFIHFIFFDINTSKLVCRKNVYYPGSKRVKQLIDTFQNCYNSLY